MAMLVNCILFVSQFLVEFKSHKIANALVYYLYLKYTGDVSLLLKQ